MVSLAILAMTAVLFFVLPRTADAAFARLISHRIYLPGFSNQVTLGEIGEVKTTSRPVMHISTYAQKIPGGLKWRGGALSDFDGKRWSNPPGDGTPIALESGQARLADAPPDRRPLYYHVDFARHRDGRAVLRRAAGARGDAAPDVLPHRPPTASGWDTCQDPASAMTPTA